MWARAVLNAMAYRDLIPVIDGEASPCDVFPRTARGCAPPRGGRTSSAPGDPAWLPVLGSSTSGAVAADRDGTLNDPAYIAGHGGR